MFVAPILNPIGFHSNFASARLLICLAKLRFLDILTGTGWIKIFFFLALARELAKKFIFLDGRKDECIKIDYKKDYYFLDYKRDLKLNIKNNFIYDQNYILFYISTLILLLILLLFHN